jgi:membrane fusion protein (multidrug efflux system)
VEKGCRMMKTGAATALASALASLLLLPSCRKPKAAAPPPPAVEVTDVIQKDVPIHQEWTGSLDGFVNAEIHPQVQGYVVKQVYREGLYVHEGDLLFDIDARQFRAVATQQYGNLNRLIAALNKARLDFARDKKLIASAAIPQQQYDNDLAALREAEAAVVQARGTVSTAQLNEEWARVTSPISGVAGIARQQVGDLVSTTTVMTTVSQVDPIKANFNISEREYLRFAEQRRSAGPEQDPAPELELILDDGSLYPHHGKVIVADRQVNLNTGTMTIEGSFPNPGNILRPGQYAKVRAVVETRKGALLVPQRAVTELQGTYQVGVVGGDSKVDIRVVQTGPEVGSLSIVEKGLNVGDKVIVSDLTRLRPGMPVHATPAPIDVSSAASSTPRAGGGP